MSRPTVTLTLIDSGKAQPDVVGALERLLEKAKAGGVRGIAIAYQGQSGEVGRLWECSDGSIPHLNYALDWLKQGLVTNGD